MADTRRERKRHEMTKVIYIKKNEYEYLNKMKSRIDDLM